MRALLVAGRSRQAPPALGIGRVDRADRHLAAAAAGRAGRRSRAPGARSPAASGRRCAASRCTRGWRASAGRRHLVGRAADVERGAAEVAAVERGEQRRVVDQLAARGIDEERAAPSSPRTPPRSSGSRSRRCAGARQTTKSDSASSPGSGDLAQPSRSPIGCGVVTSTRMPKARPRSASCAPIRPKPITPSVAPRSSRPIEAARAAGRGAQPRRSG